MAITGMLAMPKEDVACVRETLEGDHAVGKLARRKRDQIDARLLCDVVGGGCIRSSSGLDQCKL